MRTRSTWLMVLAAGAVLAAAGCTTTSAGEAGPATTVAPETTSSGAAPSSDESDGLPSDGAPKVADPFDGGRFEHDPCQALTESQTTELNIGFPGEPDDGTFGKGCSWQGRNDNGGHATISFLSEEPRGLSAIYRSKNRGEFAFFLELGPVAGHPAVAYGTADTRKAGGHCAVGVGLTDELVFVVYLDLSAANVGHKDPCQVGTDVAGMMLTTMGAS